MNKEKTFKESISKNLHEVLESIGYDKTLESTGLVEYKNINNILTFVFEWNRDYSFYCQLQFEQEQIDYPLQTVFRSLKGIANTEPETFGGGFDELIDNWSANLSKEIREYKVSELTLKSKIIQDLKNEFELRAIEYNRAVELASIKKMADRAWNNKNYSQFITTVKDRINDLPNSYSKKLKMAKNKK